MTRRELVGEEIKAAVYSYLAASGITLPPIEEFDVTYGTVDALRLVATWIPREPPK